ncbi:Unknown protein sequence [Pseudomonas savastanoi pv. phaseolicola]|nr:Unknown protein sequence [Pseudomonas savastanoi pv. phaseolicola]KPB72656.1 Unknown protein sequence [Pseudomonas amygdali pv. mellea]
MMMKHLFSQPVPLLSKMLVSLYAGNQKLFMRQVAVRNWARQ